MVLRATFPISKAGRVELRRSVRQQPPANVTPCNTTSQLEVCDRAQQSVRKPRLESIPIEAITTVVLLYFKSPQIRMGSGGAS